MKRKSLLIISILMITIAVLYVIINFGGSDDTPENQGSYVPSEDTEPGTTVVDEGQDTTDSQATEDEENMRPYGTIPPIEEGWSTLGAWEVDLSTIPNYNSVVNSFSYLALQQMIGAVLINESMTDESVNVTLPEDILEFDNQTMIYKVVIHGDTDYILYINSENYSYTLDSDNEQ